MTALALLTLAPLSGRSFYNASTGRWLNRDPVAERGGVNLYGFAENRPLEKYDPLGMLSAQNWGQSPGNCGQFSIEWSFLLQNPAPDYGYIVQHVTLSGSMSDCLGNNVPIKRYDYWEAFPIDKQATRMAGGYTDTWAWSPPAPSPLGPGPFGDTGSRGEVTLTGQAKFFLSTTTGDLGTIGSPASPLYPPWTLGGDDTISGSAPSTTVQPTWWNDPAQEMTGVRSVKAKWSCCCPSTDHLTKLTIL
jgi:hypothetical protein